MKKILTLLALCGCASALSAQEDATFVVTQKHVEKQGSDLAVSLKVDVSGMDIPKNRSVVCTPVIEYQDSIRALTPIVLNGKTRHILYQRLERERKAPAAEFEYRRMNGEAQTVDYEVRTPYAHWMDRAEVSIILDECGCGWEALQNNKSPLFDLRLGDIVPVVVYVTPQAEAVKARSAAGSAYLDFPVNQTDIRPDYRNNPAELAKIRKGIEAVRSNKYATITAVSIKGYASPEGAYEANARLAQGRAQALLDYVKGMYDFGSARMTVDSEAEDWAGLEKAVEASNLADKAELLAIIRADEPADWDAREWKLKTLNGGKSYRTLLQDIYPGLRHSDYEVDYTIRNFTVEEAKRLIFEDPSQLSLNEMFQVAQTYEAGSPQFDEVFQIAVRMYPNDPVSNLNAGISAVQAKQFDNARRYLAKAPDCPEKQLAEAAILMYQGKLDEAKPLLEQLKDQPQVSAAAEENLEMLP